MGACARARPAPDNDGMTKFPPPPPAYSTSSSPAPVAAGLALAAALKQALGRRLKIAVVDPHPGGGDGRLRTVALSAGLARISWSASAPGMRWSRWRSRS